MKKIILSILAVLLAALSNVNPASGDDFRINIIFDVEVDSKAFIQGEPITISLTVSNPKAMNAHYRNLGAGKEVNKIPQVTLGTPTKPWVNSVKFPVTDSEGTPAAVKFYANPVKEDAITLGAENFAQGYFFISPEE